MEITYFEAARSLNKNFVTGNMRLRQVCLAVRQKMTGENGKVCRLSCFQFESHSMCVAVTLQQEAFYLDFERGLLQMAVSDARPPLCAPTPRLSRVESHGRGRSGPPASAQRPAAPRVRPT